MNADYLKLMDLSQEVQPPEDGIISRTLHNDARLKAVIFGFGKGQELSEPTASMPAVMHFLSGEATVLLGQEQSDARAGTWVYIQPGARHAIVARTPLVMLLLLLKG